MSRVHAQLPVPALMLVTDSTRRHGRTAEGESWIDDVVRDAVLGGVNIVQLREKSMATGELIALGLHVRDAIAGRALFAVNGSIEAAVALAADILHLPEDGAPIAEARRRIGEGVLISAAVHSVDAAAQAQRDGADMLIAGTLFETASKPDVTTIGLDGLRRICDAATLPVIAIGGITAANAADAIEHGATGVAVIGAIFDAQDVRSAAAALRSVVDSAAMRANS